MIIWFIHGEFNSIDLPTSENRLMKYVHLVWLGITQRWWLKNNVYICDMALLKYSVLLIYDNNDKW